MARRKAEARAQEAEGRAQVEAPLLFALYLKFNLKVTQCHADTQEPQN